MVLCTGGAGFIGSHLVKSLIKNFHDKIIVYDNFDPQVHGNNPIIEGRFGKDVTVIKGDVRDAETLKKYVLNADTIFHLAAAVGVGQSQYQIKHYIDVNINGTATVLDLLVNNKHKCKHLIVAGSMSSYGEGAYKHPHIIVHTGWYRPTRREDDLKNKIWDLIAFKSELMGYPEYIKYIPMPVDEKDALNCSSIYAITKKVQEEIAILAGKTHGIPVTVCRFFNVYGPGQSLSNSYTGAIAIFLSRLLNGNRPLIYEDGQQCRDFIYVGDLVSALMKLHMEPKAFGEVFNIGTGKMTSIIEVAETLARILGVKINPEITNTFRKGDIRHCFADVKKLKSIIDWYPRTNLENGLRKVVEWSKNQKSVDNVEKVHQELLTKKGLV
jgi:dTDP-L-rhamnose 4-epimerase